MPAHPCHIAVIAALLLCVILIGASLGTDWIKASMGTDPLQITNDLRLFQDCGGVSGNTNCMSWSDYFDQYGSGSGAKIPGTYCTVWGGGSASDSTVLGRIRLAAGLIVIGMLMMLVHSIVVGLWAFGVIKNRWVRIVTSLITAAVVAGGVAVWQSFLNICDASYCDVINRSSNSSCKPGIGYGLVAVAVIIKFVCFIPMRCLKRPCDDPANAPQQQGMNVNNAQYYPVATAYGAPQQTYGQPQQGYPVKQEPLYTNV